MPPLDYVSQTGKSRLKDPLGLRSQSTVGGAKQDLRVGKEALGSLAEACAHTRIPPRARVTLGCTVLCPAYPLLSLSRPSSATLEGKGWGLGDEGRVLGGWGWGAVLGFHLLSALGPALVLGTCALRKGTGSQYFCCLAQFALPGQDRALWGRR